MNRAELKSAAKNQIRGKIGVLFLVSLIIGVITLVAELLLSLAPLGGIVSSLIITPAFALSTIRIYLNLTKEIPPETKDAFSGFDDFWAAFKVIFLVELYTFLWALLFIIPGIVKGYSYTMATYVLAENKGKSARECIKESIDMTDGYKADLFVLDLSFIGWIILVVLTLGIAGIWIIPYMNATKANAYNFLKPVAIVDDNPDILSSEISDTVSYDTVDNSINDSTDIVVGENSNVVSGEASDDIAGEKTEVISEEMSENTDSE